MSGPSFFNETRRRKCVVVEPPTGTTNTLTPGQTMTLADLSGAGTVDLIQLGLGPITPPGPLGKGAAMMLDSLLRLSIDAEDPLDVDLGTFFVAHCEADPWACDRLGVTGLNHIDWDGCSYFRRVMIPYTSRFRLELISGSTESAAPVFSQVYFYEGPTPPDLTGSRRHRFRWSSIRSRPVAPLADLDLLNIRGTGVVDSIQLVTVGPCLNARDVEVDGKRVRRCDPVWLEGNPTFTIDNDQGTFHSGGTEDFFGTQGYGFGLHQTTDSWGMPTNKLIGGNQWGVTMYRFFDRDPVVFDESCTFTFKNGQESQGPMVPSLPNVTVWALVTYYLAAE